MGLNMVMLLKVFCVFKGTMNYCKEKKYLLLKWFKCSLDTNYVIQGLSRRTNSSYPVPYKNILAVADNVLHTKWTTRESRICKFLTAVIAYAADYKAQFPVLCSGSCNIIQKSVLCSHIQ
jgi:hypothetical protein